MLEESVCLMMTPLTKIRLALMIERILENASHINFICNVDHTFIFFFGNDDCTIRFLKKFNLNKELTTHANVYTILI